MDIKVLRRVQERNDATAADTRRLLGQRRIALFNIMGGAGCGKTALLERLLPPLRDRLRCAVLEGDIATTQDAERIAPLHVPVAQLQTDGSCHLDAALVYAGLKSLPLDALDVVFVENVGNLVCPAEFDIGEHCRLAVLSVMEGDDKPSKYPAMFSRAHAVVLSKCDLLPHTNFRLDRAERDIRKVNESAAIFQTGPGRPDDDRLRDWLIAQRAALAAPAR